MFISLLLKKALPFALTFVVGTALGGLTWLFGGSEKKTEKVVVTRTYDFKRGCDSRMRRHTLVAETKPLVINYIPDARLPLGARRGGERFATALVTFGADGRVQDVLPVAGWFGEGPEGESLSEVKVGWEAVERAARRIDFTPETRDGVPVTVTREVEIRCKAD